VLKAHETLGCERVEVAGALTAMFDQPRGLEHAQVLADGRATDRQLVRQRADRHCSPAQQFQHPTTGAVS
jgi:hypothetical protein